MAKEVLEILSTPVRNGYGAHSIARDLLVVFLTRGQNDKAISSLSVVATERTVYFGRRKKAKDRGTINAMVVGLSVSNKDKGWDRGNIQAFQT